MTYVQAQSIYKQARLAYGAHTGVYALTSDTGIYDAIRAALNAVCEPTTADYERAIYSSLADIEQLFTCEA